MLQYFVSRLHSFEEARSVQLTLEWAFDMSLLYLRKHTGRSLRSCASA